MQLSPVSCYFLLLTPKYHPQHFVFELCLYVRDHLLLSKLFSNRKFITYTCQLHSQQHISTHYDMLPLYPV